MTPEQVAAAEKAQYGASGLGPLGEAIRNATSNLFWKSILGTDDPAAKRDLLIYVGAGLLVVIALLGVFR